MARLFIDGFETGKCSPFWETPEFGSIAAAKPGMSGAYSNYFTNSAGVVRLPATETEIYTACKVRLEDTYNTNVVVFRDSTDANMFSLYFNYSAAPKWDIEILRGSWNGTVLDTADAAITINTTYLLEIYYKPLNTGGQITVKLDGVQILSYSGDTTAGLEAVDNVKWGYDGALAYVNFDDIVIDNADWIGNTRIQKLQISGAGTTSEWDASAGNPEDCIDEIPYSDSDWVETNVVNESITCACSDMTGNIDSIKCVEVYGRMAYEGTPTPTKQKLAIRVNGTEYYGSDESPALTFNTFGKRWELNPDDAAAWEEADINAIEIGVRSVT